MPEGDIEINMDDALAEMGQGLDEGLQQDDGGSAPEPSTAPPPVAPARAAAPAPTSTPPAVEPWRTPPKSWKKEMHDYYGKLDPAVMQYIAQREEEFINGVAQYKHPLEEYNKVFNHYKPWFEAHQLKPMDAFTRLANSHIALLGEGVAPEVRQKYLDQLIQDYGLDEMLRQRYGVGQSAVDPQQQQIEQLLQQRLTPVEQQLQAMQRAERARREAEEQAANEAMLKEVDKFLSSPENEFAQEVIQDMVKLIQGGVATDLKTAYEAACRLNPGVAAKMLEREIQKATQPSKPPPRNVRSTGTQTPSTKPAADEDMDATLRRTLQEIQSRA